MCLRMPQEVAHHQQQRQIFLHCCQLWPGKCREQSLVLVLSHGHLAVDQQGRRHVPYNDPGTQQVHGVPTLRQIHCSHFSAIRRPLPSRAIRSSRQAHRDPAAIRECLQSPAGWPVVLHVMVPPVVADLQEYPPVRFVAKDVWHTLVEDVLNECKLQQAGRHGMQWENERHQERERWLRLKPRCSSDEGRSQRKRFFGQQANPCCACGFNPLLCKHQPRGTGHHRIIFSRPQAR